jgi:hypothetical protein
MRLLLRRPLLPAVLAALLILLALPFTWTERAPWQGIAPTLSYAGGSPDETLSPPAYPPGGSKRWGAIVQPKAGPMDQDAVSTPTAGGRNEVVPLTGGDRVLFWWVNLTSLLRF